jgi:ankyrin repeat protein
LTTVDDEDNTCLILAVRQGQGDVVVAILEKLQKDVLLTPLEKQFFVNAQNRDGNTALHEAVINDLQTISQRI